MTRWLVYEGVCVKLARQPESVIVKIGLVGIPRHRARQITEFRIGVFIRASREITGRDIRPTRVACAYVRNAHLRESRGGDYLWWCPDPKCGGAGIGFDLFEADSDIGRGIIEDVANAKLRETGTCAKLTSHSRSRT